MLLSLDANAALALAAVGLLLICAEFCLPGWVVPGVAGGVCLMCAVYRLSLLGAAALPAFALALSIALAAAAGYGLLPKWLGLAAVIAIPPLCRLLIPGAPVHWLSALFSAVPAAAAMSLLGIASRAATNKTLLQ